MKDEKIVVLLNEDNIKIVENDISKHPLLIDIYEIFKLDYFNFYITDSYSGMFSKIENENKR